MKMLLILLLSCFSVFAGPGSTGVKLMTAAGSSGVPYLFDVVSVAPRCAFSVRLLSSTYSGQCVRLRRVSDDAESDFGFVDGLLDTASITTWLGGSAGYVRYWYDQSGNGNDAYQVTTTSQPVYVANGFGSINAPAFRSTSTNDGLYAPNASPRTFSACVEAAASNEENACSHRYWDAVCLITASTWGSAPSDGERGSHVMYTNGVQTAVASTGRQDAVIGTLVGGTGVPLQEIYILGRANQTSRYYTKPMAEGVVWLSLLGAGDLAACQANQMDYFGLPHTP